jgi:hypothetical protein
LPAPLHEQRGSPARVSVNSTAQGGDAVNAKMAKGLARLAPRHQDSGAIEERQRQRPHGALAQILRLVLIVDDNFGLRAD